MLCIALEKEDRIYKQTNEGLEKKNKQEKQNKPCSHRFSGEKTPTELSGENTAPKNASYPPRARERERERGGGGGRERERDRQTDRQTHRERIH